MPGVTQRKTRDGRFIAWWKCYCKDGEGKRITRKKAGTYKYRETMIIARMREDEANRICLGLSLPPGDEKQWLGFAETVKEYLVWGTARGGGGGGPWSPTHARNVDSRLAEWQRRSGFELLEDLQNGMPQIDNIVIELMDEGKSGGTVNGYLEALSAFCGWCVRRQHMTVNPVGLVSRVDGTPQDEWRPLTPEEVCRILAVAPGDRALLYLTALFTGLRADELRHLERRHLDVEGEGLRLEKEWTKNGEPGYQPIPTELVEKLSLGASPDGRLLRVPSHTARTFDVDLRKAGVEKETPEGKAVFHSWRKTLATWLDMVGASPKELQTLIRHSTPVLTLQRYVQAQKYRQRQLLERVASLLRSASGVPSGDGCREGVEKK